MTRQPSVSYRLVSRFLRFLLLSFVLALLWQVPAQAAPEFYLVTYGPGTQAWERFGHNAIWLRDQETGEEAMYNYGFFDFEQQGFFKNFLLGRMLYYSAATDPARELPYYQRYNRSVEYQALQLNAVQAERLAQFLRHSVEPEQSEYLYDYFVDNCSTRVRDALDYALGGGLGEESEAVEFGTSLRLSALRMVQDDFWLYLGMQLGLGRNTDQPISLWQGFYLPYVLKNALNNGDLQTAASVGPAQVWSAGLALPTEFRVPYMRFLLLGLGTLLFLSLPRLLNTKPDANWVDWPCRIWWFFSGLAGVVLCFLWLATDHQAAWFNENILLLGPWCLLPAVNWNGRFGRYGVFLLAGALFVELILKFFESSQFNYDLLLWLVPAQCLAIFLYGKSNSVKKPT